MSFTPFYAASDLERLLKLWVLGSLDGIHGKGHAIVGVQNCDRMGYGFRSQSLAERYTSANLQQVIQGMAADAEPFPTHAVMLVFKHVRGLPIQDIARAFGYCDCTYAQSILCEAQDEFMRRLLAI